MSAAFGGGEAAAGQLVHVGYNAIQNALTSAALSNASLSTQLLASYLTSTSGFAPSILANPPTVGTVAGNLLSNFLANLNQ
jgi:hypothetical protein